MKANKWVLNIENDKDFLVGLKCIIKYDSNISKGRKGRDKSSTPLRSSIVREVEVKTYVKLINQACHSL